MGIIKKAWEIFTADYIGMAIEEQEAKRRAVTRNYNGKKYFKLPSEKVWENYYAEMKRLDEIEGRNAYEPQYVDVDQDDQDQDEQEQIQLTAPVLDINRPELIQEAFSDIIGYEDKKEIIAMGITAEKPIHFLLIGDKGTGKTMFLDRIYRYFGDQHCLYVVADNTTNAGLVELLFDKRPRFLLIDEIDKYRTDLQESLLGLTESGLVKETKISKTREVRLDTWVIATANDTSMINNYLADRFIVIDFSDYTFEQFVKIARHAIKMNRANIAEELIDYILEKMVLKKIKSVRKAIKISLMAHNRYDVDLVLANTTRQET